MDELLARVVTSAVVVGSFGLYHLVNGRRPRTHVLMTSIDDAIPFMPAFSVPYVLYFPFLFGTVLYGILRAPQWQTVALATLLTQSVAMLTYFFFQTHVPRPAITRDGIFESLTRYVYANDRPYNCFPSLHVAHAAGCLFWTVTFFPAFAAPLVGLTTAIILSTMFIKQHALADVAGGLALSVTALAIATSLA